MINIETLKNSAQVKSYKSGTIFSEDGIGSEMYVVIQGEVAILNSRDNKVITVVEPADFFDETLLFSDKRLPFTSLAITDVKLLSINKSNIASLMADEPSFMFELMKAMSERGEKINNAYECATGHRWAEYEPIMMDFNHECEAPPVVKPVEIQEPDNVPEIITQHKAFALFPDGHADNYELPLKNDDKVHMCEIDYTCPICNSKFKGLKILYTKLALASTDNDTRKHYKDIEPVLYEVITCPNCLYSAMAGMFETPNDIHKDLALKLKELKKETDFNFGSKPDSATVFAEYYLALLCAPDCFSKAQLIQAKLLHKLSWIYHECKDEQMETALTKQALEKYLEAYSKLALSSDQEQQLCMIIGELYFKLGNIKDAKTYYYNTKMNKMVSLALRKRAETRFEEIKQLEKAK